MGEVQVIQQDRLARYRHSVGLDIFGVLFHDASLRPQVIDGHIYLSLVSLMELVRKGKTNPRYLWRDTKKRLQQTDPELCEKISQLKMKAADGKYYDGDAASLEVVLKIIHRMRTPNARALSDLIDERVAGVVESALNYRLMNIAHGMEWAADDIHERMKQLDPPEPLSAWEEQGYSR